MDWLENGVLHYMHGTRNTFLKTTKTRTCLFPINLPTSVFVKALLCNYVATVVEVFVETMDAEHGTCVNKDYLNHRDKFFLKEQKDKTVIPRLSFAFYSSFTAYANSFLLFPLPNM